MIFSKLDRAVLKCLFIKCIDLKDEELDFLRIQYFTYKDACDSHEDEGHVPHTHHAGHDHGDEDDGHGHEHGGHHHDHDHDDLTEFNIDMPDDDNL